MNRFKTTVLPILILVLLAGTGSQALGTPQNLEEAARNLEALRLQLQAIQPPGLRGGGPDNGPRLEIMNLLQGLETRRVARAQMPSAWWTNTALLTRLGITEDQKAKIERAFENHRYNIVTSTALLDKEELQLNRLLEADTVDRGAVLNQIDRVVQARSEVERTNAAMTLEMREHLTRAQWMQLSTTGGRGGRGIGPGTEPAPAPRGGGVRGGRGTPQQ